MHFLDLEIHLVKSLHIGLFIVKLDEITLVVVFSQSTEEGSKLNPIITAFDVFEKHMLDVFFEDVEGENEGEEAGNFLLEKDPEVMLPPSYLQQFFSTQHSDVGNKFDQFSLIRKLLSQFCKTHPFFLFSLLYCTYHKMFSFFVKVNVRVSDDMFFILK